MPPPKKSLLKPTLFAASLALLALYAFFTTTSLFPSDPINPYPPSDRPPKPKIYVYDLPRRFTHGVIDSYLSARGSISGASASAAKYPGHQHSAEWWLFADLNRSDGRGDSPVEVVRDPESADLFYVPFFSSLSLVAMQEELIEWLEGQEYWRRNGGRDHVFIAQDPNALYKVVDRVKNAVLLVSDFGRLRPGQASLVKDVILPYSHRINPFKGPVGVEKRESLLFFMGNRYRKEVQMLIVVSVLQGGKIRDTLFQILEDEEDVVVKHGAQSRESRRMATQGMHSSKYCLHPAGDTPSACRLFDAIVSLCIPVIVSDYIELPFEDVVDYRKVAIFVDTVNAVKPGYLTSLLRKISDESILQYQQELKAVRRYFEYEDPNGTVNEIWRQVSSKLPLIKLMINREKRLVQRDLPDSDCSCICSYHNRTLSAKLQ
ncbi:hypothetical protein QJS04_geneDACA017785 [Acorus gramineus]|uniref:Exostosin GT47 domain-containing protein n=1 Tax=Acorus gramineus TaxID=55184 RepID=A0AAV9A0Q8_ACOGR|nr:hypothetical protein QJS04_geneDACA019785 [Acorus gramineus]KAK1280959.1 hypothetical protein QJS04_geneDACA017785 [Acorus gramineus]